MYTFKPITDPESISLLQAAGLLWYRSQYDPTYTLLPADNLDYKAWWDGWVLDGMAISEDGKLCWPDGYWCQFVIREEGEIGQEPRSDNVSVCTTDRR